MSASKTLFALAELARKRAEEAPLKRAFLLEQASRYEARAERLRAASDDDNTIQ